MKKTSVLKSILYRIEFGAAIIAAGLIRILPYRILVFLAHSLAKAAFFFMSHRRRIALENLDRVFKDTLSKEEKRRIAKASFCHIAKSLLELFVIHRYLKNPMKYFKCKGAEYLDEAFGRGKGVVFVNAHLGSWENLAFICQVRPEPWAVIVRSIRNPYLERWIRHQRQATGLHPMLKDNALRPTLRALRKNKGVAILVDQWAGPEGIWTEFFDHPTSTTSLPARLASKTGAAIIPAQCRNLEEHRFILEFFPPIPVNPQDPDFELKVTNQINRHLEEQIKKYPEQWFWGHRRWKAKPFNL